MIKCTFERIVKIYYMNKKYIVAALTSLLIIGLAFYVNSSLKKNTYRTTSELGSETESESPAQITSSDETVQADEEDLIDDIIVDEHLKNVCEVEGCEDVAQSGYSLCSSHICMTKGCNEQSVYKHSYCNEHKCKYPGCETCGWYTEGRWQGLCQPHAYELALILKELESSSDDETTEDDIKDGRQEISDNPENKEDNKQDIEMEMPDCDDYDSYEEFMDDWDGNMPDGSDAEDYWENW